ncbi:G-type lectin S-receptor-like serine/threonine-protein kinase At1g11330 isoform X2 [Salvia splendens]|uniref:G-type lectin S-receptor-like serine/threonine-protein kinase At1g11330 isoform X2 n=1 Tax=Salvia splendens TaxID=180675 RepID=UPI001C251BB8|nr:G-type lectin S-receptor-like serine/threonine-protein kinase At1g11330 isoform X2 [Salvia splendens]
MIIPSHILITAIIHLSLCAAFCRAQGGNNNTSTNTCRSNGECGVFGNCDPQSAPVCSCLPGFIPQNARAWESGNWSGGCVRKVALNCGNATIGDGFKKLDSIKISNYTSRSSVSEDECAGVCLGNCSCLAYALDSGFGCLMWSVPLIDVQTGSSLGSDIYLRLSLSDSELGHKKGFKKIFIVLPILSFVVLCVCSCFGWKWIAKRRGNGEATEYDNATQDATSRDNLEDIPLFKYEELANATNEFSEANKLGKGGFGPVYKGVLASGREIAVKRLSTASGQGLQEFMNEVKLISKLQHRNLVRLLGCCAEDREKMLVYEYMPNKSLDFFLFDQSQEVLDWRKRFNIIEGICRGLLYLHRDSRLRIIHRDLKPSNILLDNDWNPKISDFGMARIYEAKQDHVSTVRVVGTYGYMPPEYAMKGRFSEKSDTFSFGVLMLEIATGRRNTSFYPQEGSLNLLGHIWTAWKKDIVTPLIDPRISSSSYQTEVMRCIHIGLLCVQELPEDRPFISAVLSMLRSEIIELPKPKQSAFSYKSSRTDTAGVVIKDPQTITSQKQIYKLGFFTPPNTTNRYLGIFFSFSQETVIWVANRDTPLTDSSGSVTLSRDGNLVVLDGTTNQTVWSTNLTTRSSVINPVVQILDTGNLVLREDATGDVLWESFSEPTDVIVPGMTLSQNVKTGKMVALSAWKNTSDPELGSFTAGLEAQSIPQLATWNKGSLHWRSGPWNGLIFLGIKEMF